MENVMSFGQVVNAMTKTPLLRPLRSVICQIQAARLRALIRKTYQGTTDPEIAEILRHLESHPELRLPLDARPPYDFADQFRARDINVDFDEAEGYPFAVVNGNRVYFPKHFSKELIQSSVTIGLREQFDGSPHQYLTRDHDVQAGDVAVLAGASDGMFALSILDRVARLYLFEPEAHWHAPLSLTTKPWAAKVQIVPSFLSGENGFRSVTLDEFMKDKGELNFLEADVEGGESALLRGGEQTIRRSSRLRASICCYHNAPDAATISDQLKSYGMRTRYSRGYFVMGLQAPYLRRAVVYGWK
jgi:hypothetical protein